MEPRPSYIIIASAIALIIGLAILAEPSLLPLLVALALIVAGIIGLYVGFTRRRASMQ